MQFYINILPSIECIAVPEYFWTVTALKDYVPSDYPFKIIEC